MHLSPLHLSLAKLLDGRIFKIPNYQRAYSWEKRQREDLFKDINEAHRSGREHFMATVVALARTKQAIGAREFQAVELVDGQQRITTLVILLKAIENQLSEKIKVQAKEKSDIKSLLVKSDDHSLVLLQTNHDSSSIFTKYIRSGKIYTDSINTSSDQNLADAAHECEVFVKSWADQDKLIELLSTILNRLSVIYHELTDEAIVYRVFEVLNSRGLDVRWIDKTKSQMMSSLFEFVEGGARDDGLSEMRTLWQNIYRTLGMRQALGNEALRFAGTLTITSRPNRVLGEEDASAALIERGGRELKTIIASAEWLWKVVRLVSELNTDSRRSAVTKIAHARFLAIAIMLRDFDEKVRDELLSEWEKVTFRIFGLGGADTRTKIGDFVRLAHDVYNKNLSHDNIKIELINIGKDYNINKVLNNNEYWENCYEGWAEELRYILFRYEEYLAKKNNEIINTSQWNKIWLVEPSKSIEHILPQVDESDFKHHLGNLTMLPPGINSSLKDKPPAKKADVYLSCGLRHTMEVGKIIIKKSWDKKQIKYRTNLIKKFIKEEWSD